MTAEATERPEFDSESWRALRNAKLAEWIKDPDAIHFILTYSDICEVWDDLIDKDKPVTDRDVTRAFMQALLTIPNNPFFLKHREQLSTLMITGINAWVDATEYERSGDDNQKVFSYVLRDWYMELISYVIFTIHGWEYLRSISIEVRDFFTKHETLEQYKERFL